MFSYQWGSQQTVLSVYQEGRVHNLRAWFDVFGYMQGNVNAAMATAIENVACVVVFLTRNYLRSINCRFEFQYARKCSKPMIFAFLEDPRTLGDELPDWITDAAGSRAFSVLPSLPREESRVLALDFTSDQLRGVAMTTVLFGAIRQLAAARHRGAPRVAYDGSLLLYATTSALRYAVLRQKESTPVSSPTLNKCTRCDAAFDPAVVSSIDGCRKHAAYYMDDSVLAGRWICCQELQKDGPGCQLAEHIATPRTWTLDPAYGTYYWQPA